MSDLRTSLSSKLVMGATLVFGMMHGVNPPPSEKFFLLFIILLVSKMA